MRSSSASSSSRHSWTGQIAASQCSSATARRRSCCRRPSARKACSPRSSAATPTCAADPARARDGDDVREPRRLARRHHLGFRRAGDLQARGARDDERVAGRAREVGAPCRRDRPRRPAPGEPADHRVRGEARRRADGARVPDRAALRQHVGGDRAGRARRGARRRTRDAGCTDPDARVRRRPHVVLAPHPLGRADDAARHDRRRPAAADAKRARAHPRADGDEGAARPLRGRAHGRAARRGAASGAGSGALGATCSPASGAPARSSAGQAR